MTDGRGHRPIFEGTIAVRNRLRFQLPESVLPFEIEKATLVARVHAPGRKLTVAGVADGKPIALHESLNVLESVRIDITDPRALRLDGAGGLFLEVAVSGRIGPDGREIPTRPSDPELKWQIDEVGLEVRGRTRGE
jgi:hypothetical protein